VVGGEEGRDLMPSLENCHRHTAIRDFAFDYGDFEVCVLKLHDRVGLICTRVAASTSSRHIAIVCDGQCSCKKGTKKFEREQAKRAEPGFEKLPRINLFIRIVRRSNVLLLFT